MAQKAIPTMVGLHYAFYSQWGVSEDSLLYEYMQQAYDDGFYNESYLQVMKLMSVCEFKYKNMPIG